MDDHFDASSGGDSWDDPLSGGTEHLTEQSECQSFFSHNLELLARLADVLPAKLMTLAMPAWQENCALYLGLENTLQLQQVVSGEHSSLKMGAAGLSEEVFMSVHCGLRDLCTLLQLLGRLATTFLGPQLLARADTALQTIAKLLELGEFGARMRLYALDTTFETLKADVIQIHCEVLCCLRAWSHWLSQLYGHEFTVSKSSPGNGHQISGGSAVSSSNPHLSTCHSLYRQLLALAASPLLNHQTGCVPWVVVRCGVQLLLTLSVLVVSPVSLEVPQVQRLYAAPIYSSATIPPGKIREMLYRALVNLLLLPWPTYSLEYRPQHSQEERQRMLATFLQTLTQPITHEDVGRLHADSALREKSSGAIKECLSLLRSQLCQLSRADRVSSQLYWACVKDPLNKTVCELMPLYANTHAVLLEIVGTVMWAVGVVGGGSACANANVAQVCEWIEKIVHLLTQRPYLDAAVSSDTSPQNGVVTRFLQLLSLVLSDPSPCFRKLVGLVVGTLDVIYPLVAPLPTASLRQPIFAVLQTLLEHNWKYFYRPSIQQSLSQSAWEEVQNGEQLNRILQAYGQSFMQTDIGVFRQNLNTLQLLNTRYRLYSKGVFRPLLSQFLTVLLQVLIHGSHALLQDEVRLYYEIKCL